MPALTITEAKKDKKKNRKKNLSGSLFFLSSTIDFTIVIIKNMHIIKKASAINHRSNKSNSGNMCSLYG